MIVYSPKTQLTTQQSSATLLQMNLSPQVFWDSIPWDTFYQTYSQATLFVEIEKED